MSGRNQHQRRRWSAERWSNHKTSICEAYLAALERWVIAHHGDAGAKVVLPVGVVGAEELVRVLRALEISRQVEGRR
jgi:hypothetical protein